MKKLQHLPNGALLLTVSQGASLPAARSFYFIEESSTPQTPWMLDFIDKAEKTLSINSKLNFFVQISLLDFY